MDKYILGLQLMVLGMGTVLLTLYLLSLVLRLSGYLFGPERGKKRLEKQEQVKQQTSGQPVRDRKKIAAVTAAVYQMLDQKEYRVISIRRKEDSAWKH